MLNRRRLEITGAAPFVASTGRRPAPRARRRRAMPFGAALIGAVSLAVPARAQLRTPDAIDSVTSRARPETDPLGIGLGGFVLYPQLSLDMSYDDNVYRTAAPERGDVFATIRPRLMLQSRSERYPVSIEADATIRRYAKLKTENSEQYDVTANAAAEITSGTRLTALAGYARALEPRGTAGDLFVGGKPIVYDLFQANVGASRDVGRVAIETEGDLSRYTYRPAQIGGVRISQSFRNYRQTGGQVRVAYGVGPAVSVFVLGRIERSTYSDEDMLDRSSRGYSAIGGVQLGITHLLSGSVGIGYLTENFADPAYGDVSGLDYDLALNWSPTQLISVSLKGARSLERSPFVGAAGGIQSSVELNVDYELLRQLILSADVGYVRESFRGIERLDQRFDGQIGARYLLNRVVGLSLALNYRRQTSSGVGARNFNGFGATFGVSLHR